LGYGRSTPSANEVLQGFGDLADDPSFSCRMREKFAAASEEAGDRWSD